jgi:hypothetical protein
MASSLSSLHHSHMTSPDRLLVSDKPRMAKAGLGDNDGQQALSDVVLAAAKKSFGKQGAAAAQLGKDEGNFSRDARAERLTLRDLRALGPAYLATLGAELVGQYGPLSDPKDAARKALERIEDELRLLRQYVEDVA